MYHSVCIESCVRTFFKLISSVCKSIFLLFYTGVDVITLSDGEEEEEETGFKLGKLEEVSGDETDGDIEGIIFSAECTIGMV